MKAVFAVALAACASSPATPVPAPIPTPSTDELSPALAPLAWWPGVWTSPDTTEHWIAASGALYGVALHRDGSYEAMIVDDGDGPGPADGILRFIAMPGGAAQAVEFRKQSLDARAIVFANPAHDFPKTIGYARDDRGLRATLGGEREITFAFAAGSAPRAPELEAADRAFSADTAARGIDGWVAAFEPTGAMMRKTGRVEGIAIAEMMGPVLAESTVEWAPIASGVRGDLGFTVGKATFTGRASGAVMRSTYVTIWHRTAGAWKVAFDVGRIVNE